MQKIDKDTKLYSSYGEMSIPSAALWAEKFGSRRVLKKYQTWQKNFTCLSLACTRCMLH